MKNPIDLTRLPEPFRCLPWQEMTPELIEAGWHDGSEYLACVETKSGAYDLDILHIIADDGECEAMNTEDSPWEWDWPHDVSWFVQLRM